MTTTETEAGAERRTEASAIPSQPRRRGWLVRRALAAADFGGLAVSFLIAQWIFTPDSGVPHDGVSPSAETLLFFATLPGWLVLAKLQGLYDQDEERTDHSTADDVVGVFVLVTISVWLLTATVLVTGWLSPGGPKLVAFWVIAVLLVPLARSIARAGARTTEAYRQNTIIVGGGEVGQLVARKFLQHPEYGINLLGFVDRKCPRLHGDVSHVPVLGMPHELAELAERLGAERIVFAFSGCSDDEAVELVRSLRSLDVQVDLVPRLYEIVNPAARMHTVEGLPLVGLPPSRFSRSSALIKRTMDVVFAGIGLVLLSPFLLAIAAAIKLDSHGPILFRQIRMGAGNSEFRILKFRTMVVDAEARKGDLAHLNKHTREGGDVRMFKIVADPRVTRVGRFLRFYALDELPQLFNVLRGDMSLVGPRPLILEEHGHVEQWARRRLDLRPGVTGPWQVYGRSQIPFEEMVKLDYLYATGWSLGRDLSLLLRTVPVVLRGNADEALHDPRR